LNQEALGGYIIVYNALHCTPTWPCQTVLTAQLPGLAVVSGDYVPRILFGVAILDMRPVGRHVAGAVCGFTRTKSARLANPITYVHSNSLDIFLGHTATMHDNVTGFLKRTQCGLRPFHVPEEIFKQFPIGHDN
jgi:hypothetical protein